MPPRIPVLAAAGVAIALWAQCGLAQAQTNALAALVDSDPELANHFGLFSARPATLAEYGGKLVAAANVITSLTGKRTTPEALDELARKAGLYSENAYGALVALDGKSLAKLMSLASGGRYAVSLEARAEGRVPDDEAQEAIASSDLFVVLAYLDHAPMIERSIAWTPEGSMARVTVVNPLDASGAAVPYKAQSQYDPAAFDSWEFYRFRKTIK